MGIFPKELGILRGIQLKWEEIALTYLFLREKGFFTVIFKDLEDRRNNLENGPYFKNSVGLFMRHWEPWYNLVKEQFLVALICIGLYILPKYFWEMDILESIGNSIGNFVQLLEIFKCRIFLSHVRICVYMNISQPLPQYVEIEYQDEVWSHLLDYEHV